MTKEKKQNKSKISKFFEKHHPFSKMICFLVVELSAAILVIKDTLNDICQSADDTPLWVSWVLAILMVGVIVIHIVHFIRYVSKNRDYEKTVIARQFSEATLIAIEHCEEAKPGPCFNPLMAMFRIGVLRTIRGMFCPMMCMNIYARCCLV